MNEFINKAVSPFHTVECTKKELLDNGFKEIKISSKYNVSPGGRYFIDMYDSSLVAFSVSKNLEFSDNLKEQGGKRGRLRVTSSHTDFPGFKIKPNSLIQCEKVNGMSYLKINTEVYGGAILNTWLDRPLSVAGRLIIKTADPFNSRQLLVRAKDNIMVIPNLAIHMNREVNKGVELNRQKEMLPLLAVLEENADKKTDTNIDININTEISNSSLKNNLISLLFSENLKAENIKPEDVLDYELYIFNCDKGENVGLSGEMFSSPRLDNLTSVYSQTMALINADRDENNPGINVAFYFDNEEIGSRTKQGAAAQTTMFILEKIYSALGADRETLLNDIMEGTMISCDVAHATHPNYPEKNDPTNRIMLNNGLVIKISASQSYSNDGYGVGMIEQLCQMEDIKYQKFVNKSDMAGGQTLGAISSTVLPMRTIDVGIPILAMHSARELMGVKDGKNLEKFLTVFYS